MSATPKEELFGDQVTASESPPASGDRSFGVGCTLATVVTARVVRVSGAWTSYNIAPHFYFPLSGWHAGTPVVMGDEDAAVDFGVTTATRFGFTLSSIVATVPVAQKWIAQVGES